VVLVACVNAVTEANTSNRAELRSGQRIKQEVRTSQERGRVEHG
jgi:hypothetical protein